VLVVYELSDIALRLPHGASQLPRVGLARRRLEAARQRDGATDRERRQTNVGGLQWCNSVSAVVKFAVLRVLCCREVRAIVRLGRPGAASRPKQ
jgi:hypothetical protein